MIYFEVQTESTWHSFTDLDRTNSTLRQQYNRNDVTLAFRRSPEKCRFITTEEWLAVGRSEGDGLHVKRLGCDTRRRFLR